ncbi:hypothetical protein N7493_010710, partial [Penicillium malachiteum]
GRWLWDEEQQLRDRYKAFNVSGLQKLAAKAVSSKNCVSISKLAEGAYNKVFRLTMTDGKTLLAPIPNPNAGPPFYTTASEVATMEFSATTENFAGSEYILMEEATVIQLGLVWDELGLNHQLSIMREMISISFSHFGSIYFAKDAVEGAVPAQVTTDSPPELKERIYNTYIIGPTVNRYFWHKQRSSMEISRGPWSTPKEYVLSVGRREIEWIQKYAVPKPASDAALHSLAQNSPDAHLQLLEKYLKVAPSIVDIEPTLTRPALWHGDLHSSNFFVDEGHITAVIDWQGSWAGPFFLQVEPSPIVDYQGELLLKRPANFDELDAEEQAQIKRKIHKSTLNQLYLLATRKSNPLLTKVIEMNNGKKIKASSDSTCWKYMG